MALETSKTRARSAPPGATSDPEAAEVLQAADAPPTPEAASGAEGLNAAQAPAEADATGAVLEGEQSQAAQLYRDRWLRAEAEVQNVRRRAQRDVEESRRFAEDRFLLATIEQLDDLERALEATRETGAAEAWVRGVELVAQRMRDHLARFGVREIAAAHQTFDPSVHEALLEVDAPTGTTPGSVVQVERKGYERDGRPLRAARVVVARATAD